MICEKCGTLIPEGRSTCISCGAPAEKPGWAEEIEKEAEMEQKGPEPETFEFKGKNKAAYYGVASSTVGLGLVLMLILYISLPYLPGLIFAALMLLVISPIIGMVLVTSGFYKTGTIFTCIGAFTAFPIGISGRKYLGGMWEVGKETKERIKGGEKKFVKEGMVMRPPLPLKIGVIALVILILVLPVVTYVMVMNKPMLKITSYHVPDEYSTRSPVDVKVSLYNYGHQAALGDKMEIKIGGSTEGRMAWEAGDIGLMGSKTDSFRVHAASSLSKVVLFYDGEKVAEQEIEGFWVPTYGTVKIDEGPVRN